MADCGYLQSQLTSILNSLVKIAVVELLRVVEDSAVELRLEVSQIKLENQALTIENESNKTKIQSLEAELLTAGKRQCSYCCRAVEYLSPKADRDVAVPFAFSEAHDASWLQQSEYARTVEKSIATRNAVKQYLIKKEQQGEIQGSTQTGISTEVPGEQPCPKVDMVFDKEWSQVLWQGGGFKEDGESSGQEEEDTPGFKDDGDSSGQDEDDTPGPSAIHRQWITPGQSSSMDFRSLHKRRRVRGRQHPQRRGTYLKYTPKQRAKIARMCMEVGAQMAAAIMSEELGRRISPNTVRSMRISYEQTVKSMGVQKVEDLPHLRQQSYMFDEEISHFVMARRRAGGKVSPSLLVVATRDIVMRRNPEMLAENGGHMVISPGWARSWLRRFAGSRFVSKS
ncbi:hypothetical protein UPYG_G00241370 [Umbra pygmaea]|uniref:Uncharacterized protein n=1 Tax=Umbra pygmaea TaxID=75934 RepID=A0ABD0WFE3_UMBPY